MTLLLQLIAGLFVLGILVLIHELGHFIIAKACGVRVLTFSIGFGRPLITKIIGNTEYRISSIPFGGYVHMAGEHPEDGHEGASDEFTSKPVWQRASVAIAGPASNVITSILFLWILYMVGVQSQVYQKSTIIGTVEKDSPALKAGLEPKDSIISINNSLVKNWNQIKKEFTLQEKSYEISYTRKGEKKNVTIDMSYDENEGIPKFPLGGLEPVFPPRIGEVTSGSPAEKNGILPDDHILTIDNITINTWTQIPELVSNYDSILGPIQLVIMRDDSIVIINAVPLYNTDYKRFLLGIAPATETVRYGMIEAIPKALEKSWEYTTLIFDMLSKLAKRKVSPKQLAGPVGIIQMSGAAALGSLTFLLTFMALIGINLAVINLFPLIITDGGVLLFLIIEGIRGKPLTLKTQLLLNRIAIAFFIALFVFVTFNDIMRIPKIFKIWGK